MAIRLQFRIRARFKLRPLYLYIKKKKGPILMAIRLQFNIHALMC